MSTYKVLEGTLPRVAIAGATGHLGQHITNTFLSSSFRNKFSSLIVLTSQSPQSNPQLFEWQDLGATIRTYSRETSLSSLLRNVDVLVNAVGSKGQEFRDEILKAIPGTEVKLYFPSEFGVDHTVHDFGHGEWDKKKAHYELALKVLGGKVAICRVFCGLFLEDSVGPWFGFHTSEGRYEAVGDAGVKASYTSLGDVGKVVAQVAGMNPKEAPGTVHIGGDSVSMKEIAEVMGGTSGERIEVEEVEYEDFRGKALKSERKDPAECLRFLIGNGKILHTEDGMGCDNELVNPGQSYWKWKMMKDLAIETKGKPWGDVKWPPER